MLLAQKARIHGKIVAIYQSGPAELVTPRTVTQEVSAPMCSKSIPSKKTIEVELKHGTLILDECDIDLLDARWSSWRNGSTLYASRRTRDEGRKITEFLHRVVLSRSIGRPLQRNEFVDHIDGNGLNDSRSNLRLCTKQENGQNRTRLSFRNTSGVTGVSWDSQRNKWKAQIHITCDGQQKGIHLGRFIRLNDAIEARRAAELKYFGEFAPQRIEEETAA